MLEPATDRKTRDAYRAAHAARGHAVRQLMAQIFGVYKGRIDTLAKPELSTNGNTTKGDLTV